MSEPGSELKIEWIDPAWMAEVWAQIVRWKVAEFSVACAMTWPG